MELRLPENTDARELLTAHFDVRPGPATRAVATFYDTFDGRLHGEASRSATRKAG